jgi:L-threonylcarbamoyladenylate synthase
MTLMLTPDAAGTAHAATLLADGHLVAFGTETVYGLGGDATNASAVAAIYAAKNRPQFNPLICHYPTPDAALRHVVANRAACRIAEALWPGPLTLVLPRRPDCPVALLACAGLDTIAIRVPAHAAAQALLHEVARPIAAPSANRSGRISPTTAQHVMTELGGSIAAIVDSGPCPVGVESTVVDLSGPHPTLLRPGGVTIEQLQTILGDIRVVSTHGPAAPKAPGMLLSHYAPNLPVRLLADTVSPDEALLAFGPPLRSSVCTFQLSEACNLREAASRLFEGLRWLDAEGSRRGAHTIAVMPVPDQGLGRAINDRLTRAAAPRIP